MEMSRSSSGLGLSRLLALVVAVAGFGAFAAEAPAAVVNNGNFESGTMNGWTDASSTMSLGAWGVYTGTTAPISGFAISAPPEGAFALTSDQDNPSTDVVYEDLSVPEAAVSNLSFYTYYENEAGSFATPASLDYQVGPNQQYRVDLMNPAAPVDSIAPADVLANIFQTNVGDPASLAPTLITFDLTPWAGRTVRLRFAEVDSVFFFQASFDDVVVTSRGDGRVMVCTTQAYARTNGTVGTFFDVTAAGWAAGVDDVTSVLSHSTLAIYVQGYGATCLLSDIVTWGGDPNQYTLAPYKVDGAGEKTPAGVSDGWGAIYPYYARK
jgi:hypothetical protein